MKNIYCKLQIKNMSYMLINKKNDALMFKVLESIYTFESRKRFICDHTHIDL